VTETPTISTVRVAGVDLELSERGAGRPLLFLHGGAGPETSAPFLDALARQYRVLAPAHPGFGHSSLPESFDGVDDLAYFYLDFIDALGLDQITLAGHSFGGWIAAEIAVRCCHHLSRLVLIDPIGIKIGGRETRDVADIFALSAAELARLRYHDPSAFPEPDLTALADDELAIIARNNASLALFIWNPYAHNPKLRGLLHRISVPSLLIWGESDGIVTPAYGAAYQDAIPGARLATIAGAGHRPYLEQPEAFLAALNGFLAEEKDQP
jgi:pimeloyl-ACP methyl ester carboxylesterase